MVPPPFLRETFRKTGKNVLFQRTILTINDFSPPDCFSGADRPLRHFAESLLGFLQILNSFRGFCPFRLPPRRTVGPSPKGRAVRHFQWRRETWGAFSFEKSKSPTPRKRNPGGFRNSPRTPLKRPDQGGLRAPLFWTSSPGNTNSAVPLCARVAAAGQEGQIVFDYPKSAPKPPDAAAQYFKESCPAHPAEDCHRAPTRTQRSGSRGKTTSSGGNEQSPKAVASDPKLVRRMSELLTNNSRNKQRGI